MNTLQNNKNIHYTLRFASALCFIGHGCFGIITKSIWCNYFAVFGIGHDMAYQLMPFVGIIDILMGISLLLYSTRAVLGWLVVWGAITAMCRPISGEPFAEFIERAGNFGAPLVLLMLSGIGRSIKSWFSQISPEIQMDEKTLIKATKCLQLIVFLLLAGHGALNMMEKKAIIGQYMALGFSNPVNVAHFVGSFEVIAACTVIISPLRPLLFALLIWKIGTELFYPHWELFEWLERGGSYGAILALWFILPHTAKQQNNKAAEQQYKSTLHH